MKKSFVFAAWVNGTWTEIKAYKKENAVKRMQQLDPRVQEADVVRTSNRNSQQAPVETIYPEFI